MNWFYVEGGQQRGPITQEEFDRLSAIGVIVGDTLVWREGMAAWQPWSALRPVGPLPAAASGIPPVAPGSASVPDEALAPGRVRCAECGGDFATEETLRYGERHVCAACKPCFLQRLSEGAAPLRQPGRPVTPGEVLARDYQVDIGSCASRGHTLITSNYGLLLAAVIVVGLIMAAASMIPLLNLIVPLFLTGPLAGGLYRLYLARLRGQPADFGVAFSGFSSGYWQLVLCQLFPALLGFAIMIPMAMIMGPAAIFLGRANVTSGAMATGALAISAATLMLIVMILWIYFYTSWYFALRLVADKGFQFWPALQLSRSVVGKHWWGVFWFSIVSGVLMLLGAMVCLVGLLYTGPLYVAMSSYLYEDIFGDLAPQSR